MTSDRVTRFALAASAIALAAMAAVSACAPAAKDAPATSTPPSNSSSPVPSEKSVVPGGPGAFTPTINPAPVPTT